MPADMNDYFKKKGGTTPTDNNNNQNKGGGNLFNNFKLQPFIVIIIAIVFLFVFLKPFAIINSGEIGIKVRTGKYETEPLTPGLHFFIPLFERIISVNTKVRIVTYSDTEKMTLGDDYSGKFSSVSGEGGDSGIKKNPSIQVLDKRGLTVLVELAVQYQLQEKTAPTTIATWSSSWEEKIINSKVREVVRDVIGQYTAEQLPEMRNEIAKAIETKIKEKVEGINAQPVLISSVELRNIELPEKIREQIQNVQLAKQAVTIAEQQKERATQEALKLAEIAKGEAERNRIEAKGIADKIRIEAEEQAKANNLISSSLTPSLLQLEQIKVQGAFNEALKVNTNAQIFLTPGGAVPNIWLDGKSKQSTTIVQ